MSTLARPQMNGSTAVPTPHTGLQSSVQTFFSAINWDGYPPEVLPLNEINPEPLSLEMSVSRFLATFNWEGGAIAAATPINPLPTTAQKEFTLDEFSDLF